jgi:uncharacterized membrane protein YfcA
MTLVAVALAALLGGVVGVVSGLLGIGGGVLMVPFLYFLMEKSAWSGLLVPLEHQAALAHATSLAVIVPTALAGLLTFRKSGLVSWPLVFPLGLFAALAALVGARVAATLPTEILKATFGAFLVVMGVRLAMRREGADGLQGEELPVWKAAIGGTTIGFLSALLGVGGGIVAIPILIRWAGLDLGRVVPTSIGIIVFAAPAGVLSYALGGSGLPGLPSGAVGFVHVPAALAMIPGAVLLAPVGARLNLSLPTRTLRWVFAVLLAGMGAELVWSNGRLLLGGG